VAQRQKRKIGKHNPKCKAFAYGVISVGSIFSKISLKVICVEGDFWCINYQCILGISSHGNISPKTNKVEALRNTKHSIRDISTMLLSNIYILFTFFLPPFILGAPIPDGPSGTGVRPNDEPGGGNVRPIPRGRSGSQNPRPEDPDDSSTDATAIGSRTNILLPPNIRGVHPNTATGHGTPPDSRRQYVDLSLLANAKRQDAGSPTGHPDQGTQPDTFTGHVGSPDRGRRSEGTDPGHPDPGENPGKRDDTDPGHPDAGDTPNKRDGTDPGHPDQGANPRFIRQIRNTDLRHPDQGANPDKRVRRGVHVSEPDVARLDFKEGIGGG